MIQDRTESLRPISYPKNNKKILLDSPKSSLHCSLLSIHGYLETAVVSEHEGSVNINLYAPFSNVIFLCSQQHYCWQCGQ